MACFSRMIFGVLLALFGAAATLSAQNPAPNSVQLVGPEAARSKPKGKSSSLLPVDFAGWQKSADAHASKDPLEADAVDPAALREYGFTDFERATYTRDGSKIEVRAARFADAGGAYGAFTLYKSPEMVIERIGDQGASATDRVLFYRGNILVDAHLEHVTAMSAADLRTLATELPEAVGTQRNLPALPTYLPQQGYVKNSAKYVVGPAALAHVESPLPASAVDFGRGAELTLGEYTTSSGTADLVLISYPTPQIAGDRLRALEAMIAESQKSPAAPMQAVRRSGPIVAYVSGAISAAEAKSLLAAVNYDANVTWNEPTFLSKRDNIGNLVVAALVLCGIIMLLALAAGVAFGGLRILMKRLYPDRVFDRSRDVEIIRLKLGE
ncbi:MAG TPA: DUF6599 family protein [Terriglobales bacterium]|nr:DUF6599 family protein [Terriglobales bacterium]